MRNITIFLYGGFGNNLSQVNFGSLLESKNYQVKYCDVLTKKNLFTRILGWNIHDQTHKNLNLSYVNFGFFRLLKIFSTLLISKILTKNFSSVFYEGDLFVSKIDEIHLKKFKYFFGYFQSSLLLKKGIKLELISKINQSKKKDQIAIHMRGGDYAKNDRLNEDYYIKALQMIGDSHMQIKVFTNDIKYAEKILNFLNVSNYEFSNGNPFDDFIEMACSKVIISGNSTFSIWSSICSKAERIFLPKKKTNVMLSNFDLDEVNQNIEYLSVD